MAQFDRCNLTTWLLKNNLVNEVVPLTITGTTAQGLQYQVVDYTAPNVATGGGGC